MAGLMTAVLSFPGFPATGFPGSVGQDRDVPVSALAGRESNDVGAHVRTHIREWQDSWGMSKKSASVVA